MNQRIPIHQMEFQYHTHLPNTVPKKVSVALGLLVKVIWLLVITYAVCGSWITPEIEIITLASFCGDIALPLTVKLNGPAVEPVKDPLMSSSILYRPD
jgi:hypothetical protein